MTGTSAGTGRVGAGWFTLFTLAWLAIWTVQLTPLQLLLPLLTLSKTCLDVRADRPCQLRISQGQQPAGELLL